jgi:predicted 2-oxoglutarate/Fe(II)-dependent dioxygenase YbiX
MVMDYDLRRYVRVYDVISPDKCDDIMEELTSVEWKESHFYNPRTDTSGPVSGQREFINSYQQIPSSQYVMDVIYSTIGNYISDVNFHWWQGWEGFSAPRWNRYEENKVMKEHCDHIHSLFSGDRKGIPILSVLGIINDDYTGGELVFFEDQVLPLSKGQIVVFPSNFLYPHRVDPVKSGIRQSFVSWVW